MKFYDRQGEPLDGLLSWGELAEDPEYRHVAHTRITSAVEQDILVEVHSSWSGIDGSLLPDAAPLIFETKAHYHAAQELTFDRWPTENAARIGHLELVALTATVIPASVIEELDAFGKPLNFDLL